MRVTTFSGAENAKIQEGFDMYKRKLDAKLEKDFRIVSGISKVCVQCGSEYRVAKREGDFCSDACNSGYIADMENSVLFGKVGIS